MEEPIYTGIARLVDCGASLDEMETYILSRSAGADEEERSAAWLRDWLAFERLDRGAGLRAAPGGPDPL
jgi:hypothetical protein